MASVNKTILIGAVGRDPEVRYSQSGKAIANLSIATSQKRKDKQTGEYIEDTQWHRLKFFDKLAEIVGEYVKKGSTIYVEGQIKYGKFTNKDGMEISTVDIVCNEMTILSRSKDQKDQAAEKPKTQGSGFDDMDDDIPF
jgi:single-strand DNA-binding protein